MLLFCFVFVPFEHLFKFLFIHVSVCFGQATHLLLDEPVALALLNLSALDLRVSQFVVELLNLTVILRLVIGPSVKPFEVHGCGVDLLNLERVVQRHFPN